MFPRDFFLDYWRPTLRDEVFVAMPFEHRFDPVWQHVILPAVVACGLSANRVDSRTASDSILVEILDGSAHARLGLGDVSAVSCEPARGMGDLFRRVHLKPRYPNGNVMYELGLAHATRQAEEVIVIRNSDDQRLLFDVSGVRIHRYAKDDFEQARTTVVTLVRDALRAVDQSKGLQVAKVLQALSLQDVRLIRKYWPFPFNVFTQKPDADLVGVGSELSDAIADLQRLSMLEVQSYPSDPTCNIGLRWTEFARAVVAAMPDVLKGRMDPRAADAADKIKGVTEAEGSRTNGDEPVADCV